jgi:hypothetical protein
MTNRRIKENDMSPEITMSEEQKFKNEEKWSENKGIMLHYETNQ